MPFTAGEGQTPNRRRFLGTAIATAASYRRVLGANDRIRIGAIGTGERGRHLLSVLAGLPGHEIVTVCDVYELNRLQARANAAPEATDTIDYRTVLERRDIDAVVIATPDHWHAAITIAAVGTGKDVYCEKPVTHTLAEGEPLIAAVKKSGRIVQTGMQQRSWPHYMHARELIAKGGLGQVTLIRTYWYQNHIANQTGGPEVETSKLDWMRFLGPVSYRPFDADQYLHWRWYWDFGGGAMTDLFVHWVDVAQWFLGDENPTRATASGVKALLQQRQTPDTMSAALMYSKALVAFDCALLGYIEGGGMIVRGTKAAMRLHRSGFEIYNEAPGYTEAFRPPAPAQKELSQRDGTIDHMQNWLDSMRSRQAPSAPIEAGVAAARAGHVANLAMRGSGVWTA